MKKSNKKPIFILLSVIAISFASFYFFNKKDTHSLTSQKVKTLKDKKVKKNPNRSIANIPLKPLVMPNRKRVGFSINDTKTPIINEVSEDWQEKYEKRFLSTPGAEDLKDFKVTHKRSIVRKKHNLARNLEHVLVSYTLPSGYPFSFEAYIDSETGIMVHSFNRSRYEFKYRKSLAFDRHGNMLVTD